ncbi:MAG: hypothetical protein AAF196_19095 [Planctomycetota bacterium]
MDRLRAREDIDRAWDELWEGLYHQGDIGLASYAVVPHLVQIYEGHGEPSWRTFGFACAVEVARDSDRNPDLPDWLRRPYDAAWETLGTLALRDLARSTDPLLTRTALGVLAFSRGLREVGCVLAEFTDDELDELRSRS